MALSEDEKEILKRAREIERKLEQEKRQEEQFEQINKTIREREVKRVMEQYTENNQNQTVAAARQSPSSAAKKHPAQQNTSGSAAKRETAGQPRVLEEDIDKIDPDFGEPVRRTSAKKASEKVAPVQTPPPAAPRKQSVRRRRKKKRRLLKMFLLLLLLAVIVLGVVYSFLKSIASMTEYQETAHIGLRESDVYTDSDVKNILLIGTDLADYDISRSDAIILASINSKKRTIVLTSILRDSYVEIPGYGWNRINASYQYGGADLLMSTIEHNFKIGIDSFVQVDFFSFIDLIDSVGGVDIDVDEGEMGYVNGYLNQINALLGLDESAANENYLTTYGEQMHLNGAQALAYSRIRYIGTDFQRTQRQREVINALIHSAKQSSPLTWYRAAEKMLPELSTDIEDSDMAILLMKAVFYMGYERTEFRIPADGTWSDLQADVGEVLQIDFDSNRQQLRNVIYGD